MKKTIIVLALALLMVGSVFAGTATGKAAAVDYKAGTETTGSDTTQVKLNLGLSPKYVFGITDKDNNFVESGKTGQVLTPVTTEVITGKTKYNEAKTITEIVMTADLDKLMLKSTAENTYYVSYWFYECNEDNLKLYAKIDDALTYQGKGDTTGKETKIDYQATITTGSSSSVVLKTNKSGTDSTGSAEEVVATATKTDVLGNVQQGNMQIVLAPQTSDTDVLAKNVVGDYLSTITLTLKSGS